MFGYTPKRTNGGPYLGSVLACFLSSPLLSSFAPLSPGPLRASSRRGRRFPKPQGALESSLLLTPFSLAAWAAAGAPFSFRRGPRWPPRLSRPPSSLAWHTSCCCGGSIGLLLLPAATAVAVQPLLSCQIGDRDQNSLLLPCLLLLFTLPVFLEYVPRRYGNRQARTETLVPTLQTMHHYCRVLRAVRGSVVLCSLLRSPRSQGPRCVGILGTHGLTRELTACLLLCRSASVLRCGLTASVREP